MFHYFTVYTKEEKRCHFRESLQYGESHIVNGGNLQSKCAKIEMFKPIKSLLMFLQTSGVFGTTVNMDDETPIDTEKVISHEDFGEDPLSDPLALDEDSPNCSGEATRDCEVDETAESHEEDNILFVDIDVIRNGGCETLAEEEPVPEEETVPATLDIEDGEVRSEGSDSGLGLEPNAVLNGVPVQPQKTALKRRSSTATDGAKRCRRSIQFGKVTEYLFPRTQGFMCVPTKGGCTLGMGSRHTHVRSFSLSEAAEQRRMQRLQRLQLLNPRQSSSDDTDSEDEPSENSASDPDMESYDCLQPMTSAKRRKLLKEAGVKIEPNEKNVCDVIRFSRKLCGCDCKGYCDPDTCSCSQAEIKCQVDKPDFPCGCTHDGCANRMGRVEFNSDHVRTHFIHTMMRLDLEQRQLVEQEDRLPEVIAKIPQTQYPDDLLTTTVAIDEPRIPQYYRDDIGDYPDSTSYLSQPEYPVLIPEQQENVVHLQTQEVGPVVPFAGDQQYPEDIPATTMEPPRIAHYDYRIGQYPVEESLNNANYLPQHEYPPVSVDYGEPQLLHLTPNMYEEERFPCSGDFTNASSHQITHPCTLPQASAADHLFVSLPQPAFSTAKELLDASLPFDV
ncbi:uncharacterized protein LOC132256940 [Phlebotomus argentipes]|uniref:uncharacterized protein LOC132256940 n=1 Tax=Phlebotomus argentipes TaxID=94469 RepID=UPI002892BB8A|nr:uncharacterized protein LOC132256940 [Phlebotomus argentipes]